MLDTVLNSVYTCAAGVLHSAQVAPEAEILSPLPEKSDVKRLETIEELSISRVVNQHSHEGTCIYIHVL